MNDKLTRRDLMKPVQLLGLAFLSAVFAGVVTLVTMGFFQQRVEDQAQRALITGGIVAGITFIVVLVLLALMILAVDPAKVGRQIDRPVLLPEEQDAPKPGAERTDPGTPSRDS